MKYRTNRKTGDQISEIGIGSAYIFEAGMDEAVRALHAAVEGGVNYFDLAAGDGACFPIYGKAFEGIRDKVFFRFTLGRIIPTAHTAGHSISIRSSVLSTGSLNNFIPIISIMDLYIVRMNIPIGACIKRTKYWIICWNSKRMASSGILDCHPIHQR